MNVATYRERKKKLLSERKYGRELCYRCLQPENTCYFRHIQSFASEFKFVILIHRLEVRRRIATGRLSHLCLQDSHLLMGYDYSANVTLNALLEDPQFAPMVLYPGRKAQNLSPMSVSARRAIFPSGKKPLIVVIDGTWGTAKKMLRRSRNLRDLPQICFTPDKPSNFRVRQQPRPECLSTVEAIHSLLEFFSPPNRAHDNLLYVFDKMVDQQVEFMKLSRSRHRKAAEQRYRARDPQFQDILELSRILE